MCPPSAHLFFPRGWPTPLRFFFLVSEVVCEGFSFFFFFLVAVGRVCGALSRSLLPGSACRSMWCSRPVFIRVGGLSRARRGTDIHGEWRPLFSFCQRAPRLSSPPLTGGVWKAGVRSLRHEPCESPPALPAVVRGGSREARQGLRRLPPSRAFRSAHRVWPVRPSSLRAGRGLADVCRVTRPSRTGFVCARLARDPRGAPGAFQADLQRCPVLSGGGVSRFSDVCALPRAVRPSAVFLCEGVFVWGSRRAVRKRLSASVPPSVSGGR